MEQKSVCKCQHHKFIPGLVVLFALLFLAGSLDMVSSRAVEVGWPILVGVAGVLKMMEGRCKCC